MENPKYEVISPKNELEKIPKYQIKLRQNILVATKLYHPNRKIKSEVSDFFHSPDKYFNADSHVSINKKISLKKIFPLEKMEHQNKVNSNNIKISTKFSKSNSRLTSSLRERFTSSNNLNNYKENQPIRKNFEIIDNEKLKNIFKSFKKSMNMQNENKNIPSTQNINNIEYLNNNNNSNLTIPRQLSFKLNIQNRRLRSKKCLDRQTRNISKYLSRKLHKNESDLLFNSVHLYRFKKEIMDNTDENDKKNNQKFTDQNCLFKWISSLRRPKNYQGKIESYINISSEDNPLWSLVVEQYPKMKEMSVKSGYNLNNKDFNDFKRNRNLSSANSSKLRSVENLDKINVKGENLFNVEYNREMSNNISKILHKVFIDNGKVILYKDVNDMFGNETIYKNYDFHNNESSYANRSLNNMNSNLSSINL
jgi:hypothetical protein